jgi:hypothetical protein
MWADDKTSGSLRLLESLEALELGIHGKFELWRALNIAAEIEPALRGVDYERLSARAENQEAQVEAFRLEAAQVTLAEAER